MSSKEKNVPAAGAGANQDLKPKFTYAELIAELVAETACIELKPNDLTVKIVKKESGLKESRARDWLNNLIQEGRVEFVGWHKEGNGKEKVYRPL